MERDSFPLAIYTKTHKMLKRIREDIKKNFKKKENQFWDASLQ